MGTKLSRAWVRNEVRRPKNARNANMVFNVTKDDIKVPMAIIHHEIIQPYHVLSIICPLNFITALYPAKNIYLGQNLKDFRISFRQSKID